MHVEPEREPRQDDDEAARDVRVHDGRRQTAHEREVGEKVRVVLCSEKDPEETRNSFTSRHIKHNSC